VFPSFGGLSEIQILLFGCLLLRNTTFILALPLFGNNNVPSQVKVLFSLVVTTLVFPLVPVSAQLAGLLSSDQLWLVCLREVCIGITLGFILRLIFLAVSIAGEIMSVSFGLSAAQIYNPSLGSYGNVIEQFQVLLVSLVFLFLNGHHLFLIGLSESLRLAPPGLNTIDWTVYYSAIDWGRDILIAGFKMASPVMVSILLVNVGMGVVARAVPQINIFVLSMPVQISIGFLVMMFTLPFLSGDVSAISENVMNHFMQVLRRI
jgi:flagellar biosynthetic protein FliR